MPLTDSQIRSTKPIERPQKLTDGGGLYLEIRPAGSKLWRYRYRIAGKENVFALGEYFNDRRPGHLSLEAARTERDRAKVLVKQGVHPSHARRFERLATQQEGANTFEVISKEWIERKKPNWTPYYLRQVENFLKQDVYPYIGGMPIRSVTAAHLLEIIRRIEGRGAATVAVLVRQWGSAIFRYAVVTLRADTDPAAALQGVIHRPKVKHHKPLSREQAGEFVRGLAGYAGYRPTVIALNLMLLTFVRTGELRGARWDEIDFDRAEWRIPAGRMKMREAHIVPLSRQAIELLRELVTITGGREFLFPSHRNPRDCMSRTTLNTALERMGFNGKETIGFSPHGFRATASTILNECNFRPDAIERQLAHAPRNKVRAIYNQGEYLEERRVMMQQWADMVDEMASYRKRVVPLREGAVV
jgi:integrase